MQIESLSRLPQAIDKNHICTICLEVYIYPVKITLCNHVFCKYCIESNNKYVENKEICPLCRTKYRSIHVEKKSELWEKLQARYPNVIYERLELRENNRVIVRLVVGNTAKVIENGEKNTYEYEWEMIVDTPNGQPPLKEIASRVELERYPTCIPIKFTYNLEHELVRLKRRGLYTFSIMGRIYWKGQFKEIYSEFYHDLQFHHESFNYVIFHLNVKN